MLLLYEAEQRAEVLTQPEMQALIEAHNRFTSECIERGVFVCADPLHPTRTASTVRVSGSERAITDGPFAETREQLGGNYQLNCRDLDEALEFARKAPVAVDRSIEVRQVMEVPGVHAEHRQGTATAAAV
jgi:hypothetical protein